MLTVNGEAVISTDQPWNEIGEYTVTGDGEDLAREWLSTANGAFGHPIETLAAPCDLHAAAMVLRMEEQPEDDVMLDRVEGDVQEYDSGVLEGSIP